MSPIDVVDFISRICIPFTIRAIAQHNEILTVRLDLTLDISKEPTFYDCAHNPLKINSL